MLQNNHKPLSELHNNQHHQQQQQHEQFKHFLGKVNEQHDSQDQGIEDYNIGGYHPVHIGEVFINRYVVIQKLGWGHFSTVWLCKDFKYNTYVAVKVQKSSPHYMEAAFDQVQILQKVQERCHSKQWGRSRDDAHVVGLLNAFIHKTQYGNHFCMVFQILSCNLLEVIKRYNYEGLPMNLCQQIAKQVLKGLDFLHRVCGVIHTDLKPQNVMVCLSDEELKQIVESGQLTNNQLFAQRMRIIQKALGINITTNEQSKLTQIQQKLKSSNLSKNQKKSLKKKLRRQKQKQNQQENATQQEHQLQDLFDLKKGKISFNRGQKLKTPFRIKIADLGNACWKHHHFSTQIQTRQYRSPQVILGQSYNETSDLWSFGCMMYQMLTGDLLFHPRKNESWSKNEDHLAQIQELTGPFHPHFIARSPKRTKYFQKDGSMKKFPHLSYYPLNIILQIKNKIKKEQADEFAKFLCETLIAEPEKRISASKALQTSWISRNISHHYKMEQKQYAILKQQFNENQQQFQTQYPRFNDSQGRNYEESDNNCEMEDRVRCGDLRLVDRSFTDLGYIGYSEGICLDELDTKGNWQF